MNSTAAPAIYEITLTEMSAVCEYGGGFELTLWSVEVDGEWLSLKELVRRRRVGGIAARYGERNDDFEDESCDEDNGFRNTPAGFAWIRDIRVEAPRGTRLLRRFGWPDRERARQNPWLRGVPLSWQATNFQIGGHDRLQSEAAIRDLARRKSEEAAGPSAPMTPAEYAKQAEELLRRLEGDMGEPRRRRAPDPALLQPSFPSNEPRADIDSAVGRDQGR